MRAPLSRRTRPGLPAAAVLLLALAGCRDPAPTPAAPPPTPPASPSVPPPATSRPTSAAVVGSDGLTVRYLGDDGSVKTVRVEDFPR